MQVTEQMLRALGVTRCADLVACRGLLGALYSSIATDHFMAVGLGIGATLHSQAPQEGEAGRKGMSVERTFRAISSKADLEAKVLLHLPIASADLQSAMPSWQAPLNGLAAAVAMYLQLHVSWTVTA